MLNDQNSVVKSGLTSCPDRITMKGLRLGEMDAELIGKCAALYCQVWQEPPWNEIWEKEKAEADLQAQMQKPSAQGFLALKSSNVVGFTWGYAISQRDLQDISHSSNLDYLFQRSKYLYYIDELGVDIRFRGCGIGRMLSRILLGAALASEFSTVILRTDVHASPARKLYNQLGFTELPVRDGIYTDRTYWNLELR